jgi:integral membrane protein
MQSTHSDAYVKWFKIAGWLETASFLILLLIAMPMKYMMGEPALVKLMGSIHGGLFMVYVLMAFIAADRLSWSPKVRFHSLIAAIVPMGPIWFDKKYLGGADLSSSKT